MDVNKAWAGSILFCLTILTTSVVLYLLPRRLSRKTVEVMANIFHPVPKVALALGMILIALGMILLGGNHLLTMDYRGPVIRFYAALAVAGITFLVPMVVGGFGASKEIRRRKRAGEQAGG